MSYSDQLCTLDINASLFLFLNSKLSFPERLGHMTTASFDGQYAGPTGSSPAHVESLQAAGRVHSSRENGRRLGPVGAGSARVVPRSPQVEGVNGIVLVNRMELIFNAPPVDGGPHDNTSRAPVCVPSTPAGHRSQVTGHRRVNLTEAAREHQRAVDMCVYILIYLYLSRYNLHSSTLNMEK